MFEVIEIILHSFHLFCKQLCAQLLSLSLGAGAVCTREANALPPSEADTKPRIHVIC